MPSQHAAPPPRSARLTCSELLLLGDAIGKLDFVATSGTLPDWARAVADQVGEDLRTVIEGEGAFARLEEALDR